MKYIKLKIAEYLIEARQLTLFDNPIEVQIEKTYKEKSKNISDSMLFSKSITWNDKLKAAEKYFDDISYDDFHKLCFEIGDDKFLAGELNEKIYHKSIQDNILFEKSFLDYILYCKNNMIVGVVEKYYKYNKNELLDIIEDEKEIDKYNFIVKLTKGFREDYSVYTAYHYNLWKDLLYYTSYTKKIYDMLLNENGLNKTEINIYRAISISGDIKVDYDFINSYDGIGIYWSALLRFAKSYWRSGDNYYDFKFAAITDVKNVDFITTIIYTMLYNEKEIRLNKNSNVKINRIYFDEYYNSEYEYIKDIKKIMVLSKEQEDSLKNDYYGYDGKNYIDVNFTLKT